MGAFEERLRNDLLKLAEFRINLPSFLQPDDVFAELIRHFNIEATNQLLENSELRDLMLPVIRVEFRMANDYHFSPEPPWDIPIICFAARDDPYVSRRHALGWGRLRTQCCKSIFGPAPTSRWLRTSDYLYVIRQEVRS